MWITPFASCALRPRSAGAALLAAVLTACTGASGNGTTGSETSPSADGQLYVATHEGVIAVADDGSSQRVSDTADYMGFTIAGPKTFLGSGHPAEGSGDHANRGLIKSTDAGKTWKTLSLDGEVDFHALDYAHNTIYGYDSTGGLLRVSEDGKTWDKRAELAALDIAVNPNDPDIVLATTQSGIAKSTNGGKSFSRGAGPVMACLSWAKPDALYGIGPTGALHRSTDGGATPGRRPPPSPAVSPKP